MVRMAQGVILQWDIIAGNHIAHCYPALRHFVERAFGININTVFFHEYYLRC